MSGYIGSAAVLASSGAERKKTYNITGATTSLTGLNYTVGQVHVFHNGVRLVDGTDFTATNGNSITLTNAAQSGDEVVVLSYAGYQVSDTVSASQGGTFSNSIDVTGEITADGLTVNGGVNISGVSNANLQITSTGGNSYQLRTDTNDAFIYQANRGKPTVKFAYGGDISFYEDTGTTAKFFWDASAESLGIGTSSPLSAAKLSLQSDAADQTILSLRKGTGDYSYVKNDGTNMWLSSSLGSTGDKFGIDLSAPDNAMRIDSSGNVGIGTTTANETLVLNKAANNNFLKFETAGTARAYIGASTLSGGGLTGSTAGDLIIRSEAGIAIGSGGSSNIDMRIDSSGNVVSSGSMYSDGGATYIQGTSVLRAYSTLSLSPTATDVYFAHQSIIPSGTYILQVYLTGSPWYTETWVGIMRWYNNGTNSNNSTDIQMTGMGHAPNNSVLYARVQRRGSNQLDQSIQLWSNNTSNPSVEVAVKRIM